MLTKMVKEHATKQQLRKEMQGSYRQPMAKSTSKLPFFRETEK